MHSNVLLLSQTSHLVAGQLLNVDRSRHRALTFCLLQTLIMASTSIGGSESYPGRSVSTTQLLYAAKRNNVPLPVKGESEQPPQTSILNFVSF